MGEISTVERGRDGRDVEGAKGWGVLLVWSYFDESVNHVSDF